MKTINPLAIELNETLRGEAPFLYRSLSGLGKELYFPRGILSQTAEAKRFAKRYNATIGIATCGDEPMHLPSLKKQLPDVEPSQVFPYAPATGVPELRSLWREHQVEVNPALDGKSFSLPIVTSGLTHGLSICADIFCDAGNTLLLPDKMWGNYRMVFETRRGADIRQYPFFQTGGVGGMDIAAFRDTLLSIDPSSKALVLLNFPNNPTGYTPAVKEAEELSEVLQEAADAGTDVVVIMDDAYFGLFYEEGIKDDSLFSLIADSHPRITAVKLDGPTKEDYVWGFRIGFISFSTGADGDRDKVYGALEKKVGGLIRGTISNCSMPAQSLLIKAMRSPDYREEKKERYRMMRDRYEEVRQVLSNPDYHEVFEPYPFNSGYFMCLKLKDIDAEKLRLRLLEKHGVGVISLGERDLRIAYSCLDVEQVKDLFDILYIAALDMKRE